MSLKNKKVYCAIVIIIITLQTYSQAVPPPGLSIDIGVIYLLLGGVVYGVRKIICKEWF
jgi:hypothetical protein